tara:strand:+ start:211 stop:717 length:507 start_codon:yes stop_codon:yes gene_type:complete
MITNLNKYHYYASPITILFAIFVMLIGNSSTFVIGFILLALSYFSEPRCQEKIGDQSWHILYSILAVVVLAFALLIFYYDVYRYLYLLFCCEEMFIMTVPVLGHMYEGMTGINLFGCFILLLYCIHRSLQTFIQSTNARIPTFNARIPTFENKEWLRILFNIKTKKRK